MTQETQSLRASLLKLGDVIVPVKGAGEGSGSQALQAGGSKVARPSSSHAPRPSGSKAPRASGGGSAAGEDEIDSEAEAQLQRRKKIRKGKEAEVLSGMNVDCDVEREGDPPGSPGSVPRDFSEFISKLPTEQEWKSMSKIGTITALEDVMAVYGQLGVRIAGCACKLKVALDQAKEDRAAVSSANEVHARNLALERELAELKKSSAAQYEQLSKSYNDSIRQREIASDKWKEARAEVNRLQKEAEGRKSEAEILAEFRGSGEYLKELSDAAASKIQRCWIVAEKYIKTDPEAAWAGFINRYLDAEEALARGEPEPTPYVPPSPPQ